MELSFFGWYLLIINSIGFILFCINILLYTYTPQGQVDLPLTIVCLLGGSVGILLSMILFDRKAKKENMMSRVFLMCIFVIHIILYLIFKGNLGNNISFSITSFFHKNKILLIYLCIINFITFAAFALDKINALSHKNRIRIVTLLGLSFIGGSLGGLLAMYLFRHKTKKDYFTVGIPLIILMQIFLLFYLMNHK